MMFVRYLGLVFAAFLASSCAAVSQVMASVGSVFGAYFHHRLDVVNEMYCTGDDDDDDGGGGGGGEVIPITKKVTVH